MFKLKLETNEFQIFSKSINQERMCKLVKDIYGDEVLLVLQGAIDINKQSVSITDSSSKSFLHLTRLS